MLKIFFKYNKVFIAHIILILTVSLVAGCSQESNSSAYLKMAVYPTGTLSETYYFVLYDNCEFIAQEGTRTSDDITQNEFLEDIDQNKKIKLSDDDIDVIIRLAQDFYSENISTNDNLVKDSWDIQILYKDKIIKQNYQLDTSAKVKELADKIIDISPIEVDIHGFA